MYVGPSVHRALRVAGTPRRGGLARLALLCLLALAALPGARAASFTAGPDTYRARVAALQPGDHLLLEPGVYRRGLDIHDLVGSARQPIVIEGRPGATLFLARPGRNTVSIVDSAWVTVRGLALDGRGHRVDAVKAEGHARWAHHITLEGLTIRGHGHDQQTVGISTKCPAYGWVVRGNRILNAGTGMYFGDSNGSDPFVAGLIEDNMVLNPIGYALQIKHQRPRDQDFGPVQPGAREQTVIRHNRFAKSANGRADSARPNVLIGDQPPSGPGSEDRHLVYGNLFYDNDQPVEALFQGEGNLALYNNLFVNPHGAGVRVRPHNGRVREVAIFRNTLVTAGIGIALRGADPAQQQWLVQNLIYAPEPLFSDQAGDNRTGPPEAAAAVLREPAPGRAMDFNPRAAAPVEGGALPPALAALPETGQDFLQRPRGASAFGGCAYVAEPEPRPCR